MTPVFARGKMLQVKPMQILKPDPKQFNLFSPKPVVLYCYELLRFHLHFIMPCILKLSEDVGRQKVKGFAILTDGSIDDLKIIA